MDVCGRIRGAAGVLRAARGGGPSNTLRPELRWQRKWLSAAGRACAQHTLLPHSALSQTTPLRQPAEPPMYASRQVLKYDSNAAHFERKQMYVAASMQDVRAMISAGHSARALAKLGHMIDSFAISAREVADVMVEVRPGKSAVVQVTLLLRKVQSSRGVRYLVNSGLIDSYIYFCARAKRFDLAKKAFNIASLLPESSKGARVNSPLASLSLAAAMCNRPELSERLLREYYRLCREEWREIDVEMWLSTARGNISEVFELLDSAAPRHNPQVSPELFINILDLAYRQRGVRGLLHAYSMLSRVFTTRFCDNVAVVHKVMSVLVENKPDSLEVDDADLTLEIFRHVEFQTGVRTGLLQYLFDSQAALPAPQRIARMLSLLRHPRVELTAVPPRCLEQLFEAAVEVGDLALSLAIHAETLERHIEHSVSHYNRIIELALLQEENELVGTLLREFRELSKSPDATTTNLLLVYVTRRSSAQTAYAALQQLRATATAPALNLLCEMLAKVASANMRKEAEEIWKLLLAQNLPANIPPTATQAMVLMYRSGGDMAALESFVDEVKRVGVVINVATYSALQQIYLSHGDLERARRLREEVWDKLMDAESERRATIKEQQKQAERQRASALRRRRNCREARELFLCDQQRFGFPVGADLAADHISLEDDDDDDEDDDEDDAGVNLH